MSGARGDAGAGTLVLSGQDVRALLDLDACIDAVERAFRAHGEGRAAPPAVLGVHVADGGFHVKAAALDVGRSYFAAKLNANFPRNRERFGLPTIRGIVALCDTEDGRLLALLDSADLTAVRTAAATAVAARYLARPEAATVTIVGCGAQAKAQLRALARVRPLRRGFAVDADAARAEAFAAAMGAELGIDLRVGADVSAAASASDVCVTCTTARAPVLHVGDVKPGAFVAAVGADNPDKQEIAPALLAASTVVVDVLEQCAQIGDLHHALDAGVMTRADVHAELGEIVAGRKPGRRRADETIIFDSTGTALQDVAAAALVYERAVAEGRGRRVEL